MSRDIWNRQARFYDPGVNPQPRNNEKKVPVYSGASSKFDKSDGTARDRAQAKRARKAQRNIQQAVAQVNGRLVARAALR